MDLASLKVNVNPSKDEAGVMDEMVTTCSTCECEMQEGLVVGGGEVEEDGERKRGLTNPVNMME